MEKHIEEVAKKIEVLTHSSIRICDRKIIYIDPFQVDKPYHDADLVFFTHEHFDHFSIEDISKVRKENTKFIMPVSMKSQGSSLGNSIFMEPGEEAIIEGYKVEAVPAYNAFKLFHPKQRGWVGYNIEVEGVKIYVVGDSDVTAEAKAVKTDIILVPCGGKYTMNADEASFLVNHIHPSIAIPTHYGQVAGNENSGQEFANKVDPSIKTMVIKRY